uniref:SYO1-like TPR repeats domain-containing protein n=2 Tax=Timema TaxID=61471 RepID=A0A7R9IKL9_9NEOP|nr:unnamed protein product [Timema tahoe]
MLPCVTMITYVAVCVDTDDDVMDQDSSENSDGFLSDPEESEESAPLPAANFPLAVVTEVREGIINHQLVSKVWDRTVYPAENVCQILDSHTRGALVCKKLATLRCRAFLCLNNLLTTLSVEDLGGPQLLSGLWINIGTLVFRQIESSEREFLESATAALRATLQRLSQARVPCTRDLTQEDLQLMFKSEQRCSDANVRANLIRSVGSLGLILVNSTDMTTAHAMIKSIGRFLLEVCSRESELWLVAESLDTLMDVFGEDETDQAAADIALVDKLRALVPSLKYKVILRWYPVSSTSTLISPAKMSEEDVRHILEVIVKCANNISPKEHSPVVTPCFCHPTGPATEEVSRRPLSCRDDRQCQPDSFHQVQRSTFGLMQRYERPQYMSERARSDSLD